MPLSDDVSEKDTKVDGEIELYNNNVRSNDWNFSVNNLQGDLHFSNGNLVANELRGKAFNKPIKLAINTLNPDGDDDITQVNIFGNAEVMEVEQAFSIKLRRQGAAPKNAARASAPAHPVAAASLSTISSDLLG